MNHEHRKIIKTIKKLEKKHSKLSVLYSFIQLSFIDKKMKKYNNLITAYYNYLLHYPEIIEFIIDNNKKII